MLEMVPESHQIFQKEFRCECPKMMAEDLMKNYFNFIFF